MGLAAEGYVEGDSSGVARAGRNLWHSYSECPEGSAISYKIPVSALSASAEDALAWCSWCERKHVSEYGKPPSERPPPSLINYEFLGGPYDGRQLMLSPHPEGVEHLIVRPPANGEEIVRDEGGRDNMRESSYKVAYDPKTGRGLMIWQGEK